MSGKFEVALVAAMGRNREIGRNNEMPWFIPSEQKHFVDITTGRICIAGANTAKSIGKSLTGRTCFVVADPQRTADVGMFVENGWIVCATFEKALEDAAVMAMRNGSKPMVSKSTTPAICVIGGEDIYYQARDRADYIILSRIDIDIPGADAYFPEFDPTLYSVQPVRNIPEVRTDEGEVSQPAWTLLFHARLGSEVHDLWNSNINLSE